MARQFGGAKLPSPALVASGTSNVPFQSLPEGPIDNISLGIALSLKSSAAAFAAVVNTGSAATAEGVDDIDLLLGAIFQTITLYWTAGTQAFSLAPKYLRTLLGFLNRRDFEGSFVNGVSIPVSTGSATAFTINIRIPANLKNLFEDGNVFQLGARQMREGQLQFLNGSSLTPSVVLANGTAVVSALSITPYVKTGAGSESDVGSMWKADRVAGYPTIQTFSNEYPFIMCADATASASNTSTYNAGPYVNIDAGNEQAMYQADQLTDGGYDVTARMTPLVNITRHRKLSDFQVDLDQRLKIEQVSGSQTSLTLWSVVAIPAQPHDVARVAQEAGAGGSVDLSHPTPRSLPPGSSVPLGILPLLPVRVQPGSMGQHGPGTATKAASPAAASSATANKLSAARRVSTVFRKA